MSVAKAKEICLERVESRRSARSLDSEINRLKLKITSQKEQQGDREEIVRYWILTVYYWHDFSDVSVRCWMYTHFKLMSFLDAKCELISFSTYRQYHEALESYKNMTQQMKNLNSFIKSLDSVMNHRLQAYAELRR